MQAKVPSKANAGGSGLGFFWETGLYCQHDLHGITLRAVSGFPEKNGGRQGSTSPGLSRTLIRPVQMICTSYFARSIKTPGAVSPARTPQ